MLTQEQRFGIDASKTGQDLSINAGPGTGKTFFLNQTAKAHTGKPIVNLCFNSSTKKQADQRMPAWVKNYTFHGLAFGQIGKYYRHKLNLPINTVQISKQFGCEHHVAMAAKYTLRRFATSDDPIIFENHVPRAAVLSKDKCEQEVFKDEVVNIARRLWTACMSKDKRFGIEHDFYLKQWELEGARIPHHYDIVMVDEKQDMVPVNVSAVSKWRSTQKIIVGDKNQTLYQWRNSVNMEFGLNLYLTQSFRFGQDIANVANKVLDLLNEPECHLKGLPSINSRIVYGEPEGKHTVLCRSNAGLLGEVLKAMSNGSSIHVVGSMAEALSLMESAWYLSIGEKRKVRHPTMQLIGNWESVIEMSAEDQDLRMAVKRVNEYGSVIPSMCEKLRDHGEVLKEHADIVISTVHKFKGLEDDVVKLSDDFQDLVRWNKKEKKYVIMKQELCVFFVAVTRAMKDLHANSMVQQLDIWKDLIDNQ